MIRKKQVHSCAQSCIYSGFLKGQLHCWGWLECFCSSCVVQLTICRWHHPNGRKWRGAKESLDEGERGEWKSCISGICLQCSCIAAKWATSRLHPCWPTIQGTLLKNGAYKFVRASHEGECWRQSLRGHNSWLTQGLDPGNWRLLIPFPILGMCILPTLHMVGDIIKNAKLKE